ncbi:hypothetical protein BC962_1282 [Gillisia mitskevichiae]|uniref:Uncharacterized protein n=1 Tax=Gillisia mitskevichiae TaxID=270921 RepID=A0A495PS49_9FLAO|nr:hypothetical protein [Gillisia mitskevichiae]RKS53037.1 hypothetical protein BC962_1282 [Gillisia mitskevichiae]
METITTFYSWKGLFYLFIGLLALYGIIKIVIRLIENSAKKNLTNKQFIFWLRNSLFFYVPVAVIVFVLGFISINYITHSILILIIGIFGFPYIKNYLSGILFKSNPIVSKGALIKSKDLEGEIKQLMVLGMIVNTEYGEQYVNYKNIEEFGFTINSNKSSALRQTLYLKTILTQDAVLDILFDNPILNFEEKPSLKNGVEPEDLILKYTLESGATTQDLISFLNSKEIETKLTRKVN